MLPVDSLGTVFQCDWELPAEGLKKDFVAAVAENYAVWGSTVPEPTFAITNLRINASKITAYGENANFIRFVYKGIVFVKKYCQHDEYDRMTLTDRNTIGVNKKDLILNIIGQFKLNAWEDKIAPEIKILEFDAAEDKEAKSKIDTDDEWDFENKITKPVVEDDFDW